MSRVDAFAITSLLCIGCPASEDGNRSADKVGGAAPAGAAAKVEPAVVEPAVAAPAAAAAPTSPAKPTLPTTPTAEPSEPTAPSNAAGDSLPPPTQAEVRAVLGPVVPGKLAVLAPPARLDPTAYVVAWRRIDPSTEAAADVVLATVRGTPSAAGTTWALGAHHIVHHIETPWMAEPDLAIPTTLRVEDFDDDDEPEVLVRMREFIMCGGGGENMVTTLVLLDTDPPFAEALRTELGHAMLASDTETKAVVRHEDLDGDGHRDVAIRYTTDGSDMEPSREENQWIWNEATDTWTLKADNYSNWGCDW